MDEKAFRKGHNYLTLVNDLRGSRVLYVGEDRVGDFDNDRCELALHLAQKRPTKECK